jgi:hypothetical protein
MRKVQNKIYFNEREMISIDLIQQSSQTSSGKNGVFTR